MPRRRTAIPARVVARSEDPYRRFFWIVVAASIAGGVSSFVAVKIDGATTRTRLGAVEEKTRALEVAAKDIPAVLAKLEGIATQVSEMRSTIDRVASAGYSGAQAAADRAELQRRIQRNEDDIAMLNEHKATIKEALEARRGDPARIAELERRVGEIEASLRQQELLRAQFGGKP